jgi:thioredoxin-like negative regulator of GroEL
MPRTPRTAAFTLAALPATLAVAGCQAGTDSEPTYREAAAPEADFRLRSDVEAALPAHAEAFTADPDDNDARWAFADILFKLGDMWEANDVIAPANWNSRSTRL